jgi:hypothetical protein
VEALTDIRRSIPPRTGKWCWLLDPSMWLDHNSRRWVPSRIVKKCIIYFLDTWSWITICKTYCISSIFVARHDHGKSIARTMIRK